MWLLRLLLWLWRLGGRRGRRFRCRGQQRPQLDARDWHDDHHLGKPRVVASLRALHTRVVSSLCLTNCSALCGGCVLLQQRKLLILLV